MSIPFIDLKKQFEHLEPEIRTRMDAVLAHGQFIHGPEVVELERALEQFTGAKHVVTCGSGTDALLMSLMTNGIGPGDAVFVPTFTFIASAEVIPLLGATPVFVDIEVDGFNIDPVSLEAAIQSVDRSKLKPRGVVAVDMFGVPADYEKLMAIAATNRMFVLADAAQSFGATYQDRRSGCDGDIAATSFFPAKPLGCYGDGGAVFTQEEDTAEFLRSVRTHGSGKHKYDNVRIGLNARIDTIQAAILLPKLAGIERELEARQRNAARYTEALQGVVETPRVPEGATSAWAQYTIRTTTRAEVQSALKAAGVPSVVYYPRPLHLQTAFAYLGGKPGDCPISEAVSDTVLSLPMHPYLEYEQIDEIAAVVVNTVKSNRVVSST